VYVGTSRGLEAEALSFLHQKQLAGSIRSTGVSIQVAAQLLEQNPSVQVVTLTGGMIAWHNAGAPREDADGNPTTDLHPGFNDDLQEYIQFADMDNCKDETAVGINGYDAG
jgi:hypothetical protein